MKNLHLEESGYTIKTLETQEEFIKSFRLRHLVFAETLRWVSESPGNLEIDEYDRFAIPLAVFRGTEMLSYIRVVLSRDYYMLEKDFRVLVRDGRDIRKTVDTCETSRFCVHPEARADKIAGYNVFMFLFKGLYTWCRINNIRFIQTVVEDKVNRLICAKGFPCDPIGDAVTFGDNTVALAVTVDWRAFEANNLVKRPKLVEWFQINSSEMAAATA